MPKILGWRRPGKIGRRWLFIYSPIAQSVERVTVNHDVVGSSPTWGANKTPVYESMQVFLVLYISFTVGLERSRRHAALVTAA